MKSCRLAGIDVHKKMLAVVVATFSEDSEMGFECRKFENTKAGIHSMREWFSACADHCRNWTPSPGVFFAGATGLVGGSLSGPGGKRGGRNRIAHPRAIGPCGDQDQRKLLGA
jgi:hypothetical protein